jgi:hypothetical protein
LFYYKHYEKLLISKYNLGDKFEVFSETEAKNYEGHIFLLNSPDPDSSRRSFSASDASLFYIEKEDLTLLRSADEEGEISLPGWLIEKSVQGKVTVVNTSYPSWENILEGSMPNQQSGLRKRWKLNVIGLGDVGGTLVTGLRLMGGDVIASIGIYDKDLNRIKRWEFEAGQILGTYCSDCPDIVALKDDELFDCDMFVFCVSVGVPEVGKEQQDVRLVQFEGNSRVLAIYAKLARKAGFKGIFAVVSDPVDLLCKVAFNESNRNEEGKFDFMGLASDQVRGYGLGVMNARACYYAKKSPETEHYIKEGRAFGPHGEGLVIADSIENYNEELSGYLTHKTKTANLDVRSTGFKPYIAPALSSGALSLLSTIRGEWHYSATFIGGTFFGARNRLTAAGIELERNNLPEPLYNKLVETYNNLRSVYN